MFIFWMAMAWLCGFQFLDACKEDKHVARISYFAVLFLYGLIHLVKCVWLMK